ncbi:MAG: oxygen-independent coproporphyrinogen III oxidase-like protein, partial [Thiobacillus sp.]|nr:oxygen-independent coproporphyrinogen III oxidase-like protein [Thiobacillus sp.]
VAQGAHIVDARTLTRADLPFEFMMNALRLNEGVPAALFEARTGLPLIVCTAALEKARAQGLLLPGATRLQPSMQGQRFLNDLLELFLA